MPARNGSLFNDAAYTSALRYRPDDPDTTMGPDQQRQVAWLWRSVQNADKAFESREAEFVRRMRMAVVHAEGTGRAPGIKRDDPRLINEMCKRHGGPEVELPPEPEPVAATGENGEAV